MIRTKKKRHGTVEVADPDLGGAGVEVERAFLVNLGGGIRWGKDFDADLWRASEYEGSLDELGPATVEPHEVNGFDTVSGGKRAFGRVRPLGRRDFNRSAIWPWRSAWVKAGGGLMMMCPCRSVSIRSGSLARSRIGQDFGPPGNVKRGLSLEIWKLDGDGHSGNLH